MPAIQWCIYHGDNHGGLKINNEATKKKLQTLVCYIDSKGMILKPKYQVVALLFDENQRLESRPDKKLKLPILNQTRN